MPVRSLVLGQVSPRAAAVCVQAEWILQAAAPEWESVGFLLLKSPCKSFADSVLSGMCSHSSHQNPLSWTHLPGAWQDIPSWQSTAGSPMSLRGWIRNVIELKKTSALLQPRTVLHKRDDSISSWPCPAFPSCRFKKPPSMHLSSKLPGAKLSSAALITPLRLILTSTEFHV